MRSAIKICTMVDAKATTGNGSTFGPAQSGEKVFQASVSGTGAVSATVVIEGSNDPTVLGWVEIGTITLSGTTTDTDGFAHQAAWGYYRANVDAISGTGAAVTVKSSEE